MSGSDEMPPAVPARKEFAMSADDRALDDHARRLQRLEDLQIAFGPLVARVDERLAGIASDVGELKAGLGEVRAVVRGVEEKAQARDAEVKQLADSAKKRRDDIKSVIFWVGGITGPVIIAALLAALRLSGK
jgi:chromosome segregation ATPase